ncbi:Cytidylate kinase [bioreactor metagenome]|uniref:Cytidylate kinase n=1 Tax=bioreactor metagenome TaxID=1076179 RepID=A0A644W797_9ZZZZ
MKPNLVITISRQFGAGGAFIGQQIAKRLNIHYADREIIRKAAEKLSVREEDLEHRDEKTQPFWETMLMSTGYAPEFYIPINIKYAPTDAEMYAAETSIIRKIAEKGNAVIIGRGGFHILKDRPACLRVFLFAGMDSRIQRVMNDYKLSKKDAEDTIHEKDKDRARYIQAFTGTDWTDATNYDLTLDTGKLGVDKTVEAILAITRLV